MITGTGILYAPPSYLSTALSN
jgi:chromodomain-helicase-DNA-binding protein 1